MQGKKLWIAVAAVVVVGALWYLFRPERLWIDQQVNESLHASGAATVSEPAALYAGRFHGVSHETQGEATVYRLADGSRVLRFTDFETSNGPDVQVYLIAAPDASDNETVTEAGFVNVGALKGNVGDQNYTLPDDLNLETYQAVTIWCRRFGVNFATAPLAPQAG